MLYSHYCRSGGMVDALDSKSNAVMCEGSSPSSGTILILEKQGYRIILNEYTLL